ncbi:nuclear protein 96-domain-containing protein [Lentinula boryana]|uniref:Nuclear protein 96-domain-containing protein n=1 Tax=Lentinula boryana TaxID=40481 RepID=A0ABQ8QP30_9AGAR|nr:nuclear protein 96-domain-containing protein [Lentinula boryana]
MTRFRAFSDGGSSSESSSDSEDERLQPGLQSQRRSLYNHRKLPIEEDNEEDGDFEEGEDIEDEDEEDEEEEEEDDDEEEEEEEEETDSGSSSEMQEDELQVSKDQNLAARAQIGRVDSQRMHVMQTSLFRMPEEAAALKAMNQIADSSLRRPTPTLRKHGRESDGDIRSWDKRPSFAKDVQPTLTRPTRKYTRVDSTMSVTNGAEGALADAGLSMGRSFRIGWGPGGVLVLPTSGTTVLKTQTPILSSNSLSPQLLQHQLSHSPISPDDGGVPFANPSPEALRFSSFASLFPATDASEEATMFRLGSALFDPLSLHLSSKAATPDVRLRVSLLTRKDALSNWLQATVAPTVQEFLQSHLAASAPTVAFAHLTGHQLERACDAVMDGGYPTLATLIAQAGGDSQYRADLLEQSHIWTDQKVDMLIDRDLRKIYALLAGDLNLDVVHGLDWKRIFGLHFWFAEPMNTPIAQIFNSFVESTNDGSEDLTFSLLRLYSEETCSLSEILQPRTSVGQLDYTIPWHLYIILSRCMRVRDFPDRGDVRNAYADNDQPEPEPEFEGHSHTADLLTSTYALQLEQQSMIQEAVFVLLHLEGSAGRRKAIQDLLIRSAPMLDEWNIRGLVGSLKIPLRWVKEAQAIYALNSFSHPAGHIVSSSFDPSLSSSYPAYTAYELFLVAGNLDRAHDIAVLSLAPDAVLRNDYELLKELFSPFIPFSSDSDGGRVEGWYVRGKTFLDYANIMIRISALVHSETNPIIEGVEPDAVPEATRAKELDDLVRGIPRLIALLPDVLTLARSVSKGGNRVLKLKHQVALHEMTARLVKVLDRIRPHAMEQVQPQLLDEATKLQHIRAAAVSNFIKSVEGE